MLGRGTHTGRGMLGEYLVLFVSTLTKVRPLFHLASLGRFVPHHASLCDVKRHCTGLFFRLNLEKKWLRPSVCLQVQRLTDVIFIIHCSYLVIPKLYFIEIEVNSITGKICTVLK